jgi:hypothetical protein
MMIDASTGVASSKQGILKQTLTGNFILGMTLVLFAVPVVIDLLLNGWQKVMQYFAADTYYYLTVARNYATHGLFTFDQTLPTNGFHPLWQVMLGGLYNVAEVLNLSDSGIFIAILLINLVCISIGLWFLGRTLIVSKVEVPTLFLLLPFGLMAFATLPFGQGIGSVWHLVNGMESSVSILCFGALMYFMVTRDITQNARGALMAGMLLLLLVMARLDNIFFATALGAWLEISAIVQRDVKRFARTILVGLPLLIALALYLWTNVVTVGTLLPISALVKRASLDLSKIPDYLRDVATVLDRNREPSLASALGLLYRKGWRLTQMLLPIIIAVICLRNSVILLRQKRMSSLDTAFAVTAIFALILGLYNFFFIATFDQGHWYFPISTLFVSFYVLYWLSKQRFVRRLNTPIGFVAISLITLLCFVLFFVGRGQGEDIVRFYNEEVPRLQAHYAGRTPKFIEFDDGFIAYSTGYPTMSGLGFTLDSEGLEHKRNGTLLSLAYERGHTLIASIAYFNAEGRNITLETSSEVLREHLMDEFPEDFTPTEAALFDYAVDYLSSDGHFAIIRMTRHTES